MACVPDSVNMICSGDTSKPVLLKRLASKLRKAGKPKGVAYSLKLLAGARATARKARRMPSSNSHCGGNQPQPGRNNWSSASKACREIHKGSMALSTGLPAAIKVKGAVLPNT